MSIIIPLAGDWEFCAAQNTASTLLPPGWHAAHVPGDVHLDLARLGHFSLPVQARDTSFLREVEATAWVYRKCFHYDPILGESLSQLVLHGVDCMARVFLNGQLIGETANAFISHRFEVGAALLPGDNELEIHLTNGLETVPSNGHEAYAGNERSWQRQWLRKPQYNFGWDWAPRLVSCGLWREVELEVSSCGFLDELFVSSSLAPDHSAAQLVISGVWQPVSPSMEGIAVEIRIERGSEPIACLPLKLKAGAFKVSCPIPDPALWWPAGVGEQALYQCRVLLAANGAELAGTRFGVRSVRLVEDPLEDGGRRFCLEINGRELFCRGANWVPADLIPGNIDADKVDFLLQEAVDAHFNMLRVWGGGIYESARFYDRCDELGILIWQDFMYACGLYPDDNASFFANARDEASQAIRQLRNHPCIILWCGNNEIHDGYEEVYAKLEGVERMGGVTLWDQVLPALLQESLPGALYRPASPYGGDFHRSDQEGDTHSLSQGLTNEERADIHLHSHAVGRFMSEYYCWGSPPKVESLRRYLKDEAFSIGSDDYRFHANETFEGRELSVFKQYVSKQTDPSQVALYVEAMQRLHGEHMERLTDSYRRAWPVCSGALFWMYNDCWPTSGWTTHDYYGVRKALYYSIKRTFQPVRVSLREEEGGLSVWISNFGAEPFRGNLQYGRYAFKDGLSHWEREEEVVIDPGSAAKVGFFYTSRTWPWQSLWSFAMARLRGALGEIISQARLFFTSPKGLTGEEFSFPPRFWAADSIQPVQVQVRAESDTSLILEAAVPAFGVALDTEYALPDDQYFDLMPGELRRVTFQKPITTIPAVTSWNEILVGLRTAHEERLCKEGKA